MKVDIKYIFEIIKSILKNFLIKIKQTFSLPYAKLYFAVSFLLIIIFMIFTFPYDIIIINQLQKLEKKRVLRSVYVGNIDFSFFDKSTLENIYLTFKNKNEITIKNILMDTPFSLFTSKDYSGIINIYGLKYSSGNKKNINFRSAEGNIEIKFNPKSDIPETGFIQLEIRNLYLKIDKMEIPGGLPLTLPQIKFSSINVNSKIINKTFIIKNFLINGPDLKGSISGKIIFAKIFNNSKINLKMSIDSQSRIIKNNDLYKSLLASYINKHGKITINVKGNIARPIPTLTKSSGNNTNKLTEKKINIPKRKPANLKKSLKFKRP